MNKQDLKTVRETVVFLARVANVSHNELDSVGKTLALIDAALAEPQEQVQMDCSTCKHNKFPFGMCEGCEQQNENPQNEGNWEPEVAAPVAQPKEQKHD